MAEYIEREALLHDIEQSVVYTAREKITSAEMRGARKIIERIKCAPAVEPIYIHEPTKGEFKRMAAQMGYVQVVHGRWVEKEKYTFGIMYDCSLCENRILDNGHPWNYCPNCGADMRGSNDE